MRPLAVDLCSGLGGWAEGLEAAGFDVIRVDLFDMFAETGTPKPPNCLLMLQDIRTVHGSQFKRASLIVASPPCQEFSWMAMPWSRAKQVGRALRGEDECPANYRGSRTIEDLNALFNACFRIQRECNEARAAEGLPPIPMVVENVRGARPWVGPSRGSYGSYYLWGDVPALMPSPHRRSANKVPGFRFDGNGGSFQTAAVEGMKTVGHANKRDGHTHTRHLTNQAEGDHLKHGGDWFSAPSSPSRQGGQVKAKVAADGSKFTLKREGAPGCTRDAVASTTSNSPARKAASAKIAKIPLALSTYIGRVYFPRETPHAR